MNAPTVETLANRLDEVCQRQNIHDAAIFGDRANPRDQPGIFAELSRMNLAQQETNKILGELRDAVRWIVRAAVGGFVVAFAGGLVALVFKAITVTHS